MVRQGSGQLSKHRDDLRRWQQDDAIFGQRADRAMVVTMSTGLGIGSHVGRRRGFRVGSRHFDTGGSTGRERNSDMIGFDQLAVLAYRVTRGDLVEHREQRADGQYRHR